MAKYKLTITDLESGKTEFERPCDGFIAAAVSQRAGTLSSPTTFSCMFKLSPVEAVSLLVALDNEKDRFMAINPVVALCYRMKDKIFRERVSVDIAELKKQAGAL